MKRLVFPLIFMSFPLLVLAQGQTSTNFENVDSTFAPARLKQTSPNFQIDGSIESIVGASQSPNFATQHGVPLPGPVASIVPSTGGSGSGGGGLPQSGDQQNLTSAQAALPILLFHSPTFLTTQRLTGTRPEASAEILVNGSSAAVQYSGMTWARTLPLFLGKNAISIQARSSLGLSVPVVGTVDRWLVGDANNDHVVNDADLSLFAKTWRSKKFSFVVDFNEDGKQDDADLSLLVSHWGSRF